MNQFDQRVADALRRGLAYKEIAYELNVNYSTVRRAVERLDRSFGSVGRVVLIARLRGGAAPLDDWPITRAEGAVVELVLAGESNAGIAARRGVSPRTVANQLAAVYRKLGIHSRNELVVRRRPSDAWCGPCAERSAASGTARSPRTAPP